jgi:hypothetical protein
MENKSGNTEKLHFNFSWISWASVVLALVSWSLRTVRCQRRMFLDRLIKVNQQFVVSLRIFQNNVM